LEIIARLTPERSAKTSRVNPFDRLSSRTREPIFPAETDSTKVDPSLTFSSIP
jgi:hypothetical protein